VLLFEDAVERYPQNALANYNLAGQYIAMNRFPAAREHLEMALKIDPNSVGALLGLGQVDLVEGSTTSSIRLMSKAIYIAPDHPKIEVAWFTRAKAYMKIGEYQLALRDIEQVLLINPDRTDALVEQGTCLAHMNRHKEAVIAYRSALQKGVTDKKATLNLCISLGWIGEYSSAIVILDQILAMEPTDSDALFLRGIALQHSGYSGCKDLQKAADLGHKTAPAALRSYCP